MAKRKFEIKTEWVIRVIGCLIIGLGTGLLFCPDQLNTNLPILFKVSAVNTVYAYYIWTVNILIFRTLKKSFPWESSSIVRIITEILCLIIFNSFNAIVFKEYIHPLFFGAKKMSSQNLMWTLVLTNIIALLVTSIYEMIEIQKKWRRQIMKNEVLKRTNIKTEYEVLKNQVNPHFIFNCFNTLNGLIDVDPEQAKSFLEEMSEVYRYILQQNNQQFILVEKELQIIEKYFYLMKVRFGESIQLKVNIDQEDMAKFFPPLTLQILIENALKHNMATLSNPLIITIDSNPLLPDELIIRNNLQLKTTLEESTGIGLKNLKERYLYLSDKGLQIFNNEKEFVVYTPILIQAKLNKK